MKELHRLGEGVSFGERALILQARRSATIRSCSEVHLAALSSTNFKGIMANTVKMRMTEQIEFLYKFPFFKDYSRKTLQKLTYYLQETLLRRGQVVYNEGDEN